MKRSFVILKRLKLFILISFLITTNAFSQNLNFQKPVSYSKIPKLENILLNIHEEYVRSKKVGEDFLKELSLKRSEIFIADQKIKIEIIFSSENDIESFEFEQYDIHFDDYFGIYKNRVQALVPIIFINELSSFDIIKYIKLPSKAEPKIIISEGVAKIYADDFHSSGLTGNGIKVAIIDGGFEGYQNLLGTELPQNVTVKSFYNSTSGNGDITGGGEDHGTACAEIVHDVAPDAELYLINSNSPIELDYAVQYAINENVDIISFSVGFYNTSFYDGTGIVCEISEKAVNNGIVWASAAGNDAKKHYQSIFVDTDFDNFHNFIGEDETLNMDAIEGNTITVMLTWDDWPSSNKDYDLFLYFENSQGDLLKVAESINPQTGSEEPTELIYFPVDTSGTYHISVVKLFVETDVEMEIFSSPYGIQFISEEKSYSSSIVDPASSEKVLTVGAVHEESGIDVLSDFSSRGPTNDGRIKPDVVAPNAVSTQTDPIFWGTSASTPHVAGALALLKEESNARSVIRLKNLSELYAYDMGDFGKDNKFGSGLINLFLSNPPEILSITDVPNDQGRLVRISFERSIKDDINAGELAVTSYDIYRYADQNITYTLPKANKLLSLEWEYISTIPAIREDTYSVTVPTIGDSTNQGIYYSKFFIVANTYLQDIFWESNIGNGYSIDNLIPSVPQIPSISVSNEYITLRWDKLQEEDFKYFAIYKGEITGFDPKSKIPFTTTDTLYLDSDFSIGESYYYRISAFDFAGNESDYTDELSITVTNIKNEQSNLPSNFKLYQNYPNPFNPETTIRYALPTNAEVSIKIYDITGKLVRELDSRYKQAGEHSIKWDGRNNEGIRVASGIYLYRLEAFSADGVATTLTNKMTLIK